MPVLNASVFAAEMRGVRLQFWGDSVSAQMECDFRGALWQAGVEATGAQVTNMGADYSSLNASVDYVQIGCPWACGGAVGRNLSQLESHARAATHIVFNIGEHYRDSTEKHLIDDIAVFDRVLSNTNAQLVVRSPNPTHFATSTGKFAHLQSRSVPRKKHWISGFFQ